MKRILTITLILSMAFAAGGCVKSMGDIFAVEPAKTPEQKAVERHNVPPEALARAKKLSGKEHFSPSEIADLFTSVTKYGPLTPNQHLNVEGHLGTGKGIMPMLYAFVDAGDAGVRSFASGFSRWKVLEVYGSGRGQYATKLIPRREQEDFRDNFLKTYVKPGMSRAALDQMIADHRLVRIADGSLVSVLGQSAVYTRVNGLRGGKNTFKIPTAYFVARFQTVFAGDVVASVTASVGGLWFSRFIENSDSGAKTTEDEGYLPARNSIVTSSLTKADIEAAYKAGTISATEAAAAMKALKGGTPAPADVRDVDVKRDASFEGVNQRIMDALSVLKQRKGVTSSWMFLPASDPEVRYRMGVASKKFYGGVRDYRALLEPFAFGPMADLISAWTEKCAMIEKKFGKDAADIYGGRAAKGILGDPSFADNLMTDAVYYGVSRGDGGSFSWPEQRTVTVLGDGPADSSVYAAIDRDISLQLEDLAGADMPVKTRDCGKRLVGLHFSSTKFNKGWFDVEKALEAAADCPDDMVFGLALEKYQMILEQEGQGPADWWGECVLASSDRRGMAKGQMVDKANR